MAYQSLYRRYRPQRFAEVRGQEHLVRGLQNAVREDRIGHAFLFSGPRGTGKTSTARILAKVLNCETVIDGEPCGVCESCVAIEHGTSFDVHELDAASNNGVEAIRDLISKAALGTPGRTKVYILDEAHMLTPAASNALLKILEEAPEHVVFVLATTDPQKVLPTIRSRCQHFELNLLPADELTDLATYIVEDAGLELAPEAVEYAVRAGAGSARDMESALERVATAGMTPDDVSVLDELIESLCDRDTARALVAVDRAIAAGRAPRALGEDLLARLRDVFLAAVGASLDRLADHDRDRVVDQAGRLTAAGATRAMEVLGEAFVGIQDSPDPRIPLEVSLVRLTRPDAELNLAALADRISRLERSEPPQGEARRAEVPTEPRVESAPSARPARSAPSAPAKPAERAREAAAADQRPRAAAKGPGPADGARQALKDRRGGGRPADDTPAVPSPRKAEQRPEPPPAPPAKAPVVASGELPTRDELTLAWADSVLATLPRKAKTRFQVGRFVSVDDGVAVFGLPNKIHVTKCEEVKADVEAALATHFGRAVPLRIVVDGGTPSPAAPLPAGTTDAAPEPNDDAAEIDVSELTDATDAASSSIDRVAEIFPGAELVEED